MAAAREPTRTKVTREQAAKVRPRDSNKQGVSCDAGCFYRLGYGCSAGLMHLCPVARSPGITSTGLLRSARLRCFTTPAAWVSPALLLRPCSRLHLAHFQLHPVLTLTRLCSRSIALAQVQRQEERKQSIAKTSDRATEELQRKAKAEAEAAAAAQAKRAKQAAEWSEAVQEYLSPRVAAAADKGQASGEGVGLGGRPLVLRALTRGLLGFGGHHQADWGQGAGPVPCRRVCSDRPAAASSGAVRSSSPPRTFC